MHSKDIMGEDRRGCLEVCLSVTGEIECGETMLTVRYAHTHKKSWRTLQEVGGHSARKGGDIRLEHFKQ